MTNIDLLRINATKARQESNKTNTLKGCLSYVEKKQTKQHKIYNNLINTLINNPKIYDDIYNKWVKYTDENENEDLNNLYEYMNDKEFNILSTLDFIEPEELTEDLLK